MTDAETPAETPARALSRLAGALSALGVTEFAVSGGVAVGVWATPRTTRDIDVCGVLPLDAVDRILAQLDGMRIGPSELPDSIGFTIERWSGCRRTMPSSSTPSPRWMTKRS